MFFDAERIAAVRDDPGREGRGAREGARTSLPAPARTSPRPAASARPVTIRFLDPPLHEFLPHTEEECEDVAKATGSTPRRCWRAPRSWPRAIRCSASGRGRLAIVYPEIYDMQARGVRSGSRSR
ncbi:MAG: hypothetical protein R3C16_07700 [Hyphomonadaceae bacterium]